jgi:hypothetical protein
MQQLTPAEIQQKIRDVGKSLAVIEHLPAHSREKMKKAAYDYIKKLEDLKELGQIKPTFCLRPGFSSILLNKSNILCQQKHKQST